jgi:hypothetical protein
MGAVAVGALLFAVLLVVGAALLWQEARSNGEPVYLLDDASRFAADRLSEDAAARLGIEDVERILLLGFEHRSIHAEAVLGSGDAIEFVMERSKAERGDAYDPVDIAEVIAAESEYLAAIGAIGDRVEEDQP